MTDDEMIEATKQALANTTNFDGDRLASHFSDSELDDLARAAIRVIAPAVGRALRERDQAVEALRAALDAPMLDHSGRKRGVYDVIRQTLASIEGTGHD